MITDEEVEKCRKIHETLAEHWSGAYYDSEQNDTSWLLGEYVKQLKTDVKDRVLIMFHEVENIIQEFPHEAFSILDVGCGVGGFIHHTLSKLIKDYPKIEFRTSGIDISNEMITYASKNLADFNVELVNDDIMNPYLKLENEPFDVAIIMSTLSFYSDTKVGDLLRSINGKLKNGGLLLVMDFSSSYNRRGFPIINKPLGKLTNMLFSHLINEPFHFRNRTKAHLESLFSDTGFNVVKSYLTEELSEPKLEGVLVIKAQTEVQTEITDAQKDGIGISMPEMEVQSTFTPHHKEYSNMP
ncbi:MAG: class I SAM-dependent methyltransferase [Candidatus Bathyarchaeota archaeon]|nr:MAG: class I SAM-dependent methyltransferase [Candidatus Bathyarchaeota archaeon]